jgi:hypothetical protein
MVPPIQSTPADPCVANATVSGVVLPLAIEAALVLGIDAEAMIGFLVTAVK